MKRRLVQTGESSLNVVFVSETLVAEAALEVFWSRASPRVLLERLVVGEHLVAVLAHELELVQLVPLELQVLVRQPLGGGWGEVGHARILKQLDVELLTRVEEALHLVVLDAHLRNIYS
jgi:hypothetical protein